MRAASVYIATDIEYANRIDPIFNFSIMSLILVLLYHPNLSFNSFNIIKVMGRDILSFKCLSFERNALL